MALQSIVGNKLDGQTQKEYYLIQLKTQTKQTKAPLQRCQNPESNAFNAKFKLIFATDSQFINLHFFFSSEKH